VAEINGTAHKGRRNASAGRKRTIRTVFVDGRPSFFLECSARDAGPELSEILRRSPLTPSQRGPPAYPSALVRRALLFLRVPSSGRGLRSGRSRPTSTTAVAKRPTQTQFVAAGGNAGCAFAPNRCDLTGWGRLTIATGPGWAKTAAAARRAVAGHEEGPRRACRQGTLALP